MQSSFNDLTQLAAIVCEAPVSILMLNTDDVLYCKSSAGILQEDVEKHLSLFSHTQTSATDYHCILNIYNDERYHALNLKKEFPELFSYHSYYIKNKWGKHLGTLVVLSDKEKELSKLQINGLRLIGKQVAKLIKTQSKNTLLKAHDHQIQEVSNKVDDFTFIVAHDLKSPIRNIKSFVQLIKSGKDSAKDNSTYFDYIDMSIKKMTMLIDGLMDYARSDIHEQHTELLDLDALVTHVFNDSKIGLDEKDISLKKETLPVIHTHVVLLSIVLENLIDNAVKYQKNNAIEIGVSYKAQNGFHVLTVADNGIGIDAKYYDDIFKPFKRLHTQSEYEGSGLGLATCKRIMKHLKGSLSVSSQLGQGSAFTIKMPIIEPL